MKAVFIAGAGLVPAGEHWGETLVELACGAAAKALADAGGAEPSAVVVGSAFAASLAGQAQLAAHVVDALGSRLGLAARSIEGHGVEAEGATGGAALRLGELLVRSGAHERVLVVGAEKMTDLLPPTVLGVRARALDQDREAAFGFTPAAAAALLQTRYFHEHRLAADALAPFPVLAHGNALEVPHAFLRRSITSSDYARAPVVARPLGLLDCAPDCDGAAAVVVSASPHGRAPLRILGSAVAHGPAALARRVELLCLEPAQRAARAALEAAGSSLGDMSLFELDDAFAIQAALSLEAVGAAERGTAPRLAAEGAYGKDGALPICTAGGSKARGNPVGASGLYRIVEAVRALRGEAGVPRARRALVQSIGGLGATAVAHVLE